MKTRTLLALAVMVLFGFTDLSATNPDDWPITAWFSDSFSSTQIDSKWSFDNPATNPAGQSWSLTSHPGYLSMTTTGPTDLTSLDNTAPKMLQSAPSGDFRIVSHLIADPDVSYEHAGVLVMQSPTDWVRLIRDSNRNSVYLQSSASSSTWSYVAFPGSDLILRLTKQGTNYEGAFSSDGGQSYTFVGNIQGPATPSQIGAQIASTPDGNVFTAEYDYFWVYTPGTYVASTQRVPGLTGAALSVLVLLMLLLGVSAIRKKSMAGAVDA